MYILRLEIDHNGIFKPHDGLFANFLSPYTTPMSTWPELYAESKAGTPPLGSEVKRKRFPLVKRVRGVHDLGSLGKLWLLFASGGAWNQAGSCDALVSLSLASRAISTQAAAAS